jgi:nucleotide-binding universal stress UspA family protein
MVEKSMILVTWDFTEVSENALMHAQLAATKLRTNVVLLHIVKKNSEVKAAEERMHGIIADKYSNLLPKPEALVLSGNIFTTISEAAEEQNAKMVYMGTHGIKGSQKLFGSWALKVIAHTKVPFVVVQGPPPKDYDLNNIVFPLNYRRENKESVNWISFFSRYFGSKIHILNAKHTDPAFVKGIESNMMFLAKNLKTKGVDFVMENADGEKDFAKQVVEYSKNVSADAIFVMTTKDIGLTDYMMGASEQYLIANKEGLPVICVNPKPPKFGGSFSTSGS